MIKELEKKEEKLLPSVSLYVQWSLNRTRSENSDLESDGNLLPSLKCVADSESHESVKKLFFFALKVISFANWKLCLDDKGLIDV